MQAQLVDKSTARMITDCLDSVGWDFQLSSESKQMMGKISAARFVDSLERSGDGSGNIAKGSHTHGGLVCEYFLKKAHLYKCEVLLIFTHMCYPTNCA